MNCRTVLRPWTKRLRSRTSVGRMVPRRPKAQLARLGFVRVNASSGVWAAAADADGDTIVSHCRIVFGDDAAAATVDERMAPGRGPAPGQYGRVVWRAAGAPALSARAARGQDRHPGGPPAPRSRGRATTKLVLCLMLRWNSERVHLGGWPIQRPSEILDRPDRQGPLRQELLDTRIGSAGRRPHVPRRRVPSVRRFSSQPVDHGDVRGSGAYPGDDRDNDDTLDSQRARRLSVTAVPETTFATRSRRSSAVDSNSSSPAASWPTRQRRRPSGSPRRTAQTRRQRAAARIESMREAALGPFL